MKRPILVVLLLIPLLCSCIVDKELDLRKDIDPIVTVVPGMTVSFGNAGLVRTGAILNYIVQADHAIPWLDFVDFDPEGNFCYTSGTKTLNSPPLLKGSILEESEPYVSFSCTPGFDASSSAFVDFGTPFELSGSPKWTPGADAVRNIKTRPFTLDLKIALEADDASSVTVKKGFRITLPNYLTVCQIHEESRSLAADGAHALVTTEDVVLHSWAVIPIVLDVTAETEASFPRETPLLFTGDLRLSGRITVTPETGFSPDSPVTCTLLGWTDSAGLEKADVLVGGSLSCKSMDTYTTLVNYASPYVNLSDLELSFKADNRTDVPLDFSTRLQVEDEEGTRLCDYPVGTGEGGAQVLFPARGESAWFFSGQSRPEGYTAYQFPGLPEIARAGNAAHYGFSDIRVTPREKAWLRVSEDAGESLFQGTYQFYMPFMIGKGVDSAIDYQFGHFQIDTTMTLEQLTPIVFQVDIENTMPVSFRFTAEIVDKDGNVVPQYKPVVDGSVKGGSDGAPGLSTLSIGFFTRDIVPFDGIKLTFTVDSEADAGVPLNRNQGVAFRHLRLVTPDGFTFDPAWLKYVRYLQNAKRVVDDVMEIVDSFTKKSNQ